MSHRRKHIPRADNHTGRQDNHISLSPFAWTTAKLHKRPLAVTEFQLKKLQITSSGFLDLICPLLPPLRCPVPFPTELTKLSPLELKQSTKPRDAEVKSTANSFSPWAQQKISSLTAFYWRTRNKLQLVWKKVKLSEWF